MKHLLLTASIVALFTSASFATWQEEVGEQVNLEVGKTKIIQRLMKSHDYTFDLDEGALVNTITDVIAVKNKSKREQIDVPASDISFEVLHKIVNALDSLKNNPVSIGNGYYTGSNYNGVLSTTSRHNPLAYPIFSAKGDRDKNDAFLPTTYKSNFLSKALCDEIRYYAYNNGLSERDAQKLNKYVQPIFYMTQLEVMKILEGNQNLASTKRWVYGKGYDDIVKSIQSQTAHHHALIKQAEILGLDTSIVESSLVPKLVDLSFSLLSNPKRELYVTNSGQKYLLGKNKKGFVSLIHPSTGLPYPVFKDQRSLGDMNVPVDFENSPALRKQWQRVGEFVRLNDDMSNSEKTRSIILLEPVGYLFNQHLKNFHVARSDYPEQRRAEDEIIHLAHIFSNGHHIPMPFLDMFYQGRVNIHEVLSDLQRKNATHLYLTGDLFPQRLSDRKEILTDELLNYLVFKDIIDRFDEFYRYNGSGLDRMKTALNL